MKTPISYMGGKQLMAKEIVGLFPKHNIYVEAFFGGGAVLFEKPMPEQTNTQPREVVNDLNGEVCNFWRVCADKEAFADLQRLVHYTLHSRELHAEAGRIFKEPSEHDSIKRAWAFWCQCNGSFGHGIGNGWAYARASQNTAIAIANKRERFTDAIYERLRSVHIDNLDAVKLIKNWDTPETLFYLDPPYPNTEQGHYSGYTMQDFCNLLDLLKTIQGKFIISSFPLNELTDATTANNWHTKTYVKQASMRKSDTWADGKQGKKIEVVTANFELEKQLALAV